MPSQYVFPRRSSAAVLLITLGGLGMIGCSGGSDPVQSQPGPSELAAVAGTSPQTATVGTAVPTAPAVRLLSTNGQPIAGVTVSFSVTAGGGQVAAASTQTNANGVASPGAWTLGTVAGENELTATAGSLTTRLAATAAPGPVTALSVASGNDQAGTTLAALPAPVVVRALDTYGNRVPNATVSFAVTAGGGTVQPVQATTNTSGEAQAVWTLGEPDGAQTLGVAAGMMTASATAQAETPILQALHAAVGNQTQCVRNPSQEVRCWGSNMGGTVGDGTNAFRARPVALNLTGVALGTVSLSSSTGCALTTTDNAAYCWGSTAIGDGSFAQPRWSPVAVSGGHRFKTIVIGNVTVCAIDLDGQAWCWGNGLPSENTTARRVPTLVSSTLRFVDVAIGRELTGGLEDYACGITTETTIYCWGIRGIGDPAQYPIDARYTPKTLGGDVTLSGGLVAAAGSHFCGLDLAGAAYCWGNNANGQLGIGTVGGGIYTTPQRVQGGYTFESLAAGLAHTCGLAKDGTTHCWGLQTNGALGTGIAMPGTIPTPQTVPTPAGVVRFTRIGAGGHTTCAIASTTMHVYCWGVRSTGETTATVDAAPTPVRGR
jgi:hypothetical protein